MIVSGRQQRDSVIHVCIFPQTPLPSRLPHNTERSFPVLFTRILLVIHFKYSSVYMLVPGSLTQFHFLKSIIFSPIVYESTLFSIPSLKMFFFFFFQVLNLLQYCFCCLCSGFGPGDKWDLSYPNRDGTHSPCTGSPTTGPSGRSLKVFINNLF